MSDTLRSANPSVDETISIYENMLKSSPNDQMALESLAAAYEKAGNTLRARSTLIKLSRVILSNKDSSAALAVIELLKPHSSVDFDALEAQTSLETLIQEFPPSGPREAAPVSVEPPPSGVILDKIILNREMSLAWELFEAGQLKQEEYSVIVDDITGEIAESKGSAVSVLHSVVDRSVPGFDGLVQHLKDKSHCPYLNLSAFEPQPVDLHGVPKSYLLRQGAVAFDSIGGELLIGLLNPVDDTLKKDLRHYLNVPCHFYFVTPEEFDRAWEKIGVDQTA